MPNMMAALPNIGGAVCSTPQSLANAHYYTMFQKKTGPFVISSYRCFASYELQENFQKYTGGVACCEYGINVCDSLTTLC